VAIVKNQEHSSYIDPLQGPTNNTSLESTTHVPTHSKKSSAGIPRASSSGLTPIISWGSTFTGMADPKSFTVDGSETSVATLNAVVVVVVVHRVDIVVGRRFDDGLLENPSAIDKLIATQQIVKSPENLIVRGYVLN
jgi:hypothetical protein